MARPKKDDPLIATSLNIRRATRDRLHEIANLKTDKLQKKTGNPSEKVTAGELARQAVETYVKRESKRHGLDEAAAAT